MSSSCLRLPMRKPNRSTPVAGSHPSRISVWFPSRSSNSGLIGLSEGSDTLVVHGHVAHGVDPGIVARAFQYRNSAVHETFLLQLVLHGQVGRQPLGGGNGIGGCRQEAIFLADEHPVSG